MRASQPQWHIKRAAVILARWTAQRHCKKMAIAEFILWADAQPDDRRYELLNGKIVAQAYPLIQHGRLIAGMF